MSTYYFDKEVDIYEDGQEPGDEEIREVESGSADEDYLFSDDINNYSDSED